MPDDGVLSDLPALFTRVQTSVKPSKPFVFAQRRLTYGELFERISRLLALYERARVRLGDRVVIASDDAAAVVTLFLSLLRQGATAVVLDPKLPPEALEAAIRKAEPRLLFLDSGLARRPDLPAAAIAIDGGERTAGPSLFGRVAPGYCPPSFDGAAFPAVLKNLRPLEQAPEELPATTVASLLMRPGETSGPDRIELTHRQLFAQASNLIGHYGFDADTRLLNVLPLHRPEAMTQGAVAAFAAGATLYRPPRFQGRDLPLLLDLVHRHRITHFVTAPSLLPLLLAAVPDGNGAFATDDFRCVISTGAGPDADMRQRFEAHFQTRIVDFVAPTSKAAKAAAG